MSRVIQTTDADGKTITKTNSYTELATGLHYLQGGKLLESKAEITLLPQGGAAATQGQHKAYFPANLNGGVIDLVMPDGRELKSQVRGLGYYDKASGKNVILAEVRDTEGTLYPPNVIVYENAFNGVNADVRYTYTRYGFEQDIIFREPIEAPDKFGLSPESTRIETLTEFIESPTPKKSVSTSSTKATDPDQNLDFASMTMVRGRAFSIGDQSRTNQSIPVSKSWEQIEGRNFLIEQVDYSKVEPQLQALPKPVKGASLKPKSRNSRIGRLASGRQLPAAGKVASKATKPLRIAKASQPEDAGFVLDYIMVNPGENNFTFESGQTYLVDTSYLQGTTTIEEGTFIKHSYTGYTMATLFITGPVICNTTPCNPAYITHMDDNTVGQAIGNGYPARTYGSLLHVERDYANYSSSPWEFKNLVIKLGEIAIHVADNNDVYVRNCQFLTNLTTVQKEVGNYGGSLYFDNVLFEECDNCIVVNWNQPVTVHNHTESFYSAFCVGVDPINQGGSFQQTGYCPPPTVACADVMTGINTPITINLSGSDGPDCQNNLTFSIVPGFGPNPPATLSAITKTGPQTATVVYSPNSTTFEGTDGFNYTASNCEGESAPGSVTIAVVPAPVLTTECQSASIKLSWTLPAFLQTLAGQGYIKDFQIFRCSGVNCTPSTTPFATISDPSITSDPLQWQFLDTSVTPGQTYCYQILFRHQSTCDVTAEPYKSPKSTKVCYTACCPSGSGFWVGQDVSAQLMAEWIMEASGYGVTIVSGSAHFSGNASAHGIWGNGTGANLPIDKGVILASGAIANAVGDNDSSRKASNFYVAPTYNGDLDLEKLVGNGSNTRDAVSLEFDFMSSAAFTWQIEYIYASEEYPEYIADEGGFNDPMAIFVTSTKVGNDWVINASDNIALIPSTTIPVSVNTVNGGGFSKVTHTDLDPRYPEYYRDNNDPNNSPRPEYDAANQIYDFQYDGITAKTTEDITTGLTAQKSISANVTYHVKIAIADYGDADYDSAVLIKAATPCD